MKSYLSASTTSIMVRVYGVVGKSKELFADERSLMTTRDSRKPLVNIRMPMIDVMTNMIIPVKELPVAIAESTL